MWQNGPPWLCDKAPWPQWPKSQRTSAAVLNAVAGQDLPTNETSICNIIDINRFNDYSKLLATFVYVYRFCYRTGITGPPSTPEVEVLERAWLKSEQLRCYPQVFSHLSDTVSHGKTSAPPIVRQLNLFFGTDGLIHAQGRFSQESSLILLPHHSRLADLIIMDCHSRMRHVGFGGTIVALRSRFWVPSARSATRRLLDKCVPCKKVTDRHFALPAPPQYLRFVTTRRSVPLPTLA